MSEKQIKAMVIMNIIDNCTIELDNTGQERYSLDEQQFGKCVDTLVKNINVIQCCMGETELDEDVSVNIQHKSLGKFKLVKKQDSETEQLANFCKKISKQEDCPAEFQEIVNKEFWNLIG